MADAGQSSIAVAVRVRPFTIREAAQLQRKDDNTVFLGDGSLAAAPQPKLHTRGLRNVIKVVDDRCLVFDPPEDNPVQKFSRSVVPSSRKTKDQVFAFDRVFDDNTTQSDVYEGTTKNLLDNVLDGYNATVFAYGATGCGKTHTITGTSQQPGIIFLTMQELFEKIDDRSQDKTTELTLSYLEIYNETIRDLLVPGGSKAGLMLREDSNQAVTVAGLTSHRPKDVQEVMDMIIQGNEYRTVSPTEANATSSRSHAVLQINIAQKDRNADVNEPHTMATLSIIDLAGSERASVTKNRGERLTEGANINKSLLALGSCINALCDRRGRAHVPYRNSKLTRLLKFSLGGNCKTVMIVCVSPSSAHFDETQNTLRYANRAKNIQTKVTRNVFNVNRHVKDFLVKIDEQMALINELKAQQKDAEKLFFAKFRKQCEKRDVVAREGIQRLRMAFDNSASERQERIHSMKKLRAFEKRIGLLSGWVAAFDTVCDQRGDEDALMPENLTSIRKTAQGILAELESSRHHMHGKLAKSSWERHIDTALSHSLKQLDGTDGADQGEANSLKREAELLKTNFNRDAYWEVLEQDKAGDSAMMQMLLTAQFDILTSLSDTLAMDEEAAVAHAKEIIHRLLQTGYTTASQVVKPDGSLPVVEMFSPTRKGTPKRKKTALSYIKPLQAPAAMFSAASSETSSIMSPLKSSPRRRKAPVMGAAKKGVSFTPVKKADRPRGVRWRDDASEQGTLVDFSQTPKKYKTPSPAAAVQAVKLSPAREPKMPPVEDRADTATPVQVEEMPTVSTTASATEDSSVNEESSPSLELPEVTSLPATSKPSRFQAGFLSKGRLSMIPGSPLSNPPSLSLNLSSSANSTPEGARKASPSALRSLDVAKTGNLSPPHAAPSRIGRLTPPRHTIHGVMDENNPPSNLSNMSVGSDSEQEHHSGAVTASSIDPKKLRSAMNSFNKEKARRASLMTGMASSKKGSRRISSFGSLPSSADRSTLGGTSSLSRPSLSGAAVGPHTLASSTNGISRHRRGSGGGMSGMGDRKRSPPLMYSSPADKDRGLTPGQARRMNMMSMSTREGVSPSSASDVGGMAGGRRVTTGLLAQKKESRASMWR